MTKTLEDTKKTKTLIKQSLLQTKKTGKQALSLGRTRTRSLQLGDPRPKVRKVPRRRLDPSPKPRQTLTTPVTRRSLPLRDRTKMNLVRLFLILLHPVIPSILSRASVEPVWAILLLPFLRVLIG